MKIGQIQKHKFDVKNIRRISTYNENFFTLDCQRRKTNSKNLVKVNYTKHYNNPNLDNRMTNKRYKVQTRNRGQERKTRKKT